MRVFSAQGNVRSLAPGQTFVLSQHARHPCASRFRVLAVYHRGRNNLSADFFAQLHRAFFAGGRKPDAKQPEQTRGLKLAAASGKAVLHAQKDKANANALKNVAVSSNAAVTVASPTSLKLACGGAGIELKGGNITVYAPGGASFKAGMKKLTEAEKGGHSFPFMPQSVSPDTPGVHSQQVDLSDLLGMYSSGNAPRTLRAARRARSRTTPGERRPMRGRRRRCRPTGRSRSRSRSESESGKHSAAATGTAPA
jgi:hypothetical protein